MQEVFIKQLLKELEEKGLLIRKGKTPEGKEKAYLLLPSGHSTVSREKTRV